MYENLVTGRFYNTKIVLQVAATDNEKVCLFTSCVTHSSIQYFNYLLHAVIKQEF